MHERWYPGAASAATMQIPGSRVDGFFNATSRITSRRAHRSVLAHSGCSPQSAEDDDLEHRNDDPLRNRKEPDPEECRHGRVVNPSLMLRRPDLDRNRECQPDEEEGQPAAASGQVERPQRTLLKKCRGEKGNRGDGNIAQGRAKAESCRAPCWQSLHAREKGSLTHLPGEMQNAHGGAEQTPTRSSNDSNGHLRMDGQGLDGLITCSNKYQGKTSCNARTTCVSVAARTQRKRRAVVPIRAVTRRCPAVSAHAGIPTVNRGSFSPGNGLMRSPTRGMRLVTGYSSALPAARVSTPRRPSHI